MDEVEEDEGKTSAEGLLTVDTLLYITLFKTILFHIWKN